MAPLQSSRVYKYCDFERALKIIETGKILARFPSTLNDLFDSQPKLNIDPSGIPLEARSRMKWSGSLMLDVSPGLNGKYMPEFEALVRHVFPHNAAEVRARFWPLGGRQIGVDLLQGLTVVCFSKTWKSLLMWAHYAKEHTGAVIAIRRESKLFDQRINANDEFRILRPVKYDVMRTPRDWSHVSVDSLLFRKGADWAYEDEMRIVFPEGQTAIQPGLGGLVELPAGCIDHVIIGSRVTAERGRELLEALRASRKFSDARVRHARPDPSRYGLGFQHFPDGTLYPMDLAD
jgi:hypothetical protein